MRRCPWEGVEEFPLTGSTYDRLAKGTDVFNVFPDSYGKFIAAQRRMDATIEGMIASITRRPPSTAGQNTPMARTSKVMFPTMMLAGLPPSTILTLQDGVFIGIGAVALFADFAFEE